ncbi:MAG TPA: MFS transporter, partial [Syntrophorhabdaceae bacterium]|nr:MFS transporter [Syntrophorhabdaceae bacterium]
MGRYEGLSGKALLFLFFLWFLWFTNFSLRVIFSPIMPILEDEFAVTHAKASGVFVFLSIGYGTAVVLSGFFSGRIGYKRSIVSSLALLSLVAFLIPLVNKFYLLYAFAFLVGISVGLYIPSAIPLITEYYSEKDWGKAISIHDTGASSAIFATPFIVLGLLQFVPWRGIFVVFGCVFLACSVVFYLVSTEVRLSDLPRGMLLSILKMKILWIMAVLWIFGAGANLGIYSIAPLYLTKELGLDIGRANTIVGISRIGSLVTAGACGFLIDRFNLKKFMFNVMIISGVITILLGIAPVRYTGIVLFLQAFFVTGFFPIGLVMIAKAFNREMMSLATGITLAISMISGGGIIPYLLGICGDLYSFRIGIV